MNTLFALALACTLSTAPNNDDNKITSRETSTYVVTENLALWLTDAGKLKLMMGHQPGKATIELRNEKGRLFVETVDLRKGVQQTFDLSEVTSGTYQIQVKIGDQVTTKTIQIDRVQSRTMQLS
ncbi:MAG: hypothetical protein JWP57_3341 [Spirosoma sp.]|nr:hypothetical protein [Spirosoma sp.]